MKSTISVEEITKIYLRENGYDGLTDEEECGCGLNDLFPCEGETMPFYKNSIIHCVAAYRHEDKFGQVRYSTERRK